jgi:hypothetical protein
MRMRAIVVVLGALALGGCGQGADRREVRAVAARFYAAVGHHDGATACGQLSQETLKTLEQQEKAACDQAVGALGLTPARVDRIEVFIVNARVLLSNGASAFLDRTAQGWRISALGCRPTGGDPRDHPLGCAVQS